jgi:hypothetical protein
MHLGDLRYQCWPEIAIPNRERIASSWGHRGSNQHVAKFASMQDRTKLLYDPLRVFPASQERLVATVAPTHQRLAIIILA